MKIGFYPICGDILHAGHILAIQEAANSCDYLIVGLNTNPDNKTPVQSVLERWIQLNAVKGIDQIIPYAGRKDCELLCKSLDYQVRFVGDDYRDREWDGKQIEKKRGILVHYLNRYHGWSSTELKERILKNSQNS